MRRKQNRWPIADCAVSVQDGLDCGQLISAPFFQWFVDTALPDLVAMAKVVVPLLV